MSIAYRSTVRIRRVLTRRPWLYWIIVVGLAAVLATATRSNLAEVQRERESWGGTTTVWVATADISAGQTVREHAAARHVALAMTPVHAVNDITDLDGVARQRISVGEIITTVDVTATDDQLALVPVGWLAVVVTESPRSGATKGSQVQLTADGVVIADEALVIGEVDGSTLVAVPADVAPLVPMAAQSGTLTLLRVP
ncbi:MAG TPA: SAF domain-containing protein [Ilumatobacter sp.]|nr:SAF domain-containing protein [Ilumatobacter sp.]